MTYRAKVEAHGLQIYYLIQHQNRQEAMFNIESHFIRIVEFQLRKGQNSMNHEKDLTLIDQSDFLYHFAIPDYYNW